MSDGPGYMATAKAINDASVRKSYRNEVIEECARIAENGIELEMTYTDIAAAIRALKDRK